MESSLVSKSRTRIKRALRVRKHLRGTESKPRLCVVKSNAHVYAQLIDDDQGKVLASASTISKALRNTEYGRKNKDSAKQIGLEIAKQAMKLKVGEAIFDRGSNKYHGVIAAVADGAREGGLKV